MNSKKLIRLTEVDLHRIVKESVNKVLNEIDDTPAWWYQLGRLGKMDTTIYGDDKGVTNYSRDKVNTDDSVNGLACLCWRDERPKNFMRAVDINDKSTIFMSKKRVRNNFDNHKRNSNKNIRNRHKF